MQKIYLVIGILLSALAVALGAFGAHGLKKVVSVENVAIYQTGVQYRSPLRKILLQVVLVHQKFDTVKIR